MSERARDETWHRQPVLWLGLMVFVASLAGCVLMIVLATRYDEKTPQTVDRQILKVPLTRHPPPASGR